MKEMSRLGLTLEGLTPPGGGKERPVPRTPVAHVAPEVLSWARRSIGFDTAEAARRMNVAESRLLAWESGEARPSIAQLRKASNVYKRPTAVFFLPEPPSDFDAMRDFRRLPDTTEVEWSPQLHVEYRRAQHQREVAIDLREIAGEEPATVAVPDPSSDPEELGKQIRALLGVSLANQREWRNEYDALNGWVEAVEASGVLVIQTSRIDLKEMRGFSFAEQPIPVIALNGSDSVRGRIFTLMHEMAHIVLRSGGLCDLHEGDTRANRALEAFCNQVAAATLLPADDFITAALEVAGDLDDWPETPLGDLAVGFGVSKEVVLRRLVTLDLAPLYLYLRRREEYLRAYQESRERQAEGSGFVPYLTVKLRDLGRGYVRQVMEAYQRNDISVYDATDFLDMKAQHFPEVQRRALGNEAA